MSCRYKKEAKCARCVPMNDLRGNWARMGHQKSSSCRLVCDRIFGVIKASNKTRSRGFRGNYADCLDSLSRSVFNRLIIFNYFQDIFRCIFSQNLFSLRFVPVHDVSGKTSFWTSTLWIMRPIRIRGRKRSLSVCLCVINTLYGEQQGFLRPQKTRQIKRWMPQGNFGLVGPNPIPKFRKNLGCL